MRFPGNIYLFSFVGAALITALALPSWRAWCRRAGLVDDPGARKIHELPMPLAGGLAIMTGLVVPLVLVLLALQLTLLDEGTSGKLNYGFHRRAWQLGALLLGAVGMFGLGWLDDKHELKP